MSEDRLAHVKSRLDTINSILDKLWTIATADEDVTEDEQAIIISVKANIDSYRKVANKLAREEDISDPDLARLHSFEK
ncbi:MAG: hypothetical protein ACXAE3_16865, partial [Candidatus Kariarchaeaceae archaeon]